MEQENSVSERNNNAEWHRHQDERIARVAKEMGRLFTPGHETPQTGLYEATRQEYLWELHVKAEHDKSVPPHYSDHRFS